ncbi:MAG TPA: hypothetical protein VLM85_28440 [Polyangiaceae bacterium]|nr:hypothetical protein [Polyangiaceae bacterium]
MAGPRSAAAWKRFYAEERARLGERALAEMLEAARPTPIALGRAAVFPHTRLEVTGAQVAAVARGVVESGASEVLALGVLHGARERDAELVKSARAGDEIARDSLRRVHRTGGHAEEEFSLDAFVALVALEARRAGRPAPAIEVRYPFLVGDEPATLPGVDELRRAAEQTPVVATTDPMHYGVGYGTPGDLVGIADLRASSLARASIEAQLAALSCHDFGAFARECERARSDFRDVGPVLALVLGRDARFELLELRLVDYAEALSARPPTWVAGARVDAVTAPGRRAPRTAATPA